MGRRRLLGVLFVCIGVLWGCGEDHTPKPRAYFRIDFPEKAYQEYSNTDCPFSFEYPLYTKVEKDSTFFGEKTENPCWMNIQFPEFGGTIYLSYKEIDENNSLPSLIEDAHKMTFKHTIKADYIDESEIKTDESQGILYEVGGNAASNVQFYVTDSSAHFIRGALYFNTAPNEDSLAPVIRFVKDDMKHLIKSLRWKEGGAS